MSAELTNEQIVIRELRAACQGVLLRFCEWDEPEEEIVGRHFVDAIMTRNRMRHTYRAVVEALATADRLLPRRKYVRKKRDVVA